MALFDSIIILFTSLFDLVKGAFILAIPVFLLVLLGDWLKKRLEAKRKLSWLQSTLLSTYIIATLLILVLYFGGYALILQSYTGGSPPPSISPTPEFALIQTALFLGVSLFKKLFAGLALTLVILPFTVIGSLILERLKGKQSKKAKKERQWLPFFASVFLVTLLAYLGILVFDFIPAGVIFLIFNY